MKKLYIFFLIHLFGFSLAQKVLNTPAAANSTVSDKVSISMQPGFSVKATSGSKFVAFIDTDGNGVSDYQEQFMPSLDENYIKTIECLNIGCSETKETVVYFDGLGREKQILQVKASPNGKTIAVPIEYDGFGRQAIDYLPVPTGSSNSKFIPNPSVIGTGTTYYSTNNYSGELAPFSEKTFENSPLNRVMFQAAPGKSWKKGANEIEFQYATNTMNEVLNFGVNNPTATPELVANGSYYDKGTLYKTITIDENDQPIQEFKDKEGKVILKRIDTSDGRHDTYYVYDIYGNLTFVLPPKLVEAGSYSANLPELGYQYQYDDKNRLIEKQLPGKGREFMVYDNQNRLVATQDKNQRNKGFYTFMQYDKFGRLVTQGQHPEPNKSRVDIQNYVNGLGTNNIERATSSFPQSNLDIYYTRNAYGGNATGSIFQIVNYYDNYNFGNNTFPTGVLEGSNTKLDILTKVPE